VNFSGGAFIRFSARSPKDSATERGRMNLFLKETLKDIAADDSSNETGLPAVYRAFIKALKVRSGKEAMEVILVSVRILEDLQMAMVFPELWDVCVIIREWTDIPIEMEFRGFVHNKKFTALSQYYYDCFFLKLKQNKDAIASQILEFWENMKEKIPYNSYNVDFVILESGVKIIEFNPFDESTDGALFHWKLHKHLLEEGPFTFKIINESWVTNESSWWKKIIRDFKKLELKDS